MRAGIFDLAGMFPIARLIVAFCVGWSLMAVSTTSAAPIVPDSASKARGATTEPERRSPPRLAPDKRRTRQGRETQDVWRIPRKDVPEKTKLASFHSDLINRDISYLVYLPPGYERISNERIRYPVIYMLPNYAGDCREFGPMIGKIDDGIGLGLVPPVIVVCVQGVYGSMYTDSRDRGRPIESIIVRELIPRIDSTFRTIPDREHRGLEGFGMGGFGAAHLGFKYPHLFGVVSMFAPPIGTLENFQDDMPLIASDVWADNARYFRDNDPWYLVERNLDQIRGKTKIRLFCGELDRYAVFAEDFHARLQQLGIEHEYKIVPGAKHNLGNMLLGVMYRVLPFWKESFPPYVPPATTQSTTAP